MIKCLFNKYESPLIQYYMSLHWRKFSNINGTFKRVIGILVNWHIPTIIFKENSLLSSSKYTVEMRQFTRIPMSHLNAPFMLLNFPELRECLLVCLSRKWNPTGIYFADVVFELREAARSIYVRNMKVIEAVSLQKRLWSKTHYNKASRSRNPILSHN